MICYGYPIEVLRKSRERIVFERQHNGPCQIGSHWVLNCGELNRSPLERPICPCLSVRPILPDSIGASEDGDERVDRHFGASALNSNSSANYIWISTVLPITASISAALRDMALSMASEQSA